MACVLVYVDADVLRTSVPERRRGATWAIQRNDLSHINLDLLDELSVLFVITVEDDRAVLVARIDGAQPGDAAIVDRDITHLLPRLGCASVGAVATWANVPRVLPPSDVDVLTYLPGAPRPVRLPAPVVRDVIVDRLRAAIYADLASDAARMVFADYLQERGEPWGELIALQLARRGTGTPPLPREAELLAQCAPACAGPLAPYLRPGFVVRRGFVAACATIPDKLPDHIVTDVAWSTVEDLESSELALLESPALASVRRVGVSGAALAALVASEHELAYETIVGNRGWSAAAPHRQCGVVLAGAGWEAVLGVGALSRLRALSIAGEPVPPAWAAQFRASPLAAQLLHLDVVLTSAITAAAWRRVFDRSNLRLLTIRTVALGGAILGLEPDDAFSRLAVRPSLPSVCVGLERRGGPPRLVLQLAEPIAEPAISNVVELVAQVSHGIDRIEVHDLDVPSAVDERHAGLIAALAATFRRVVAGTGPSLAP